VLDILLSRHKELEEIRFAIKATGGGLDAKDHVDKVGTDAVWLEGGPGLEVHDDDNVISDVTLAFQLLLVSLDVRKHRGHMEHDFIVMPCREHRVLACTVILHIQATRVVHEALQAYLLSQKTQEILKVFSRLMIVEDVLFSVLFFLDKHDTKLEAFGSLVDLVLDHRLLELGSTVDLELLLVVAHGWADHLQHRLECDLLDRTLQL